MSTSPQPLITKYRPITWDEVIGNTQVVNALRDAVNSETRPHAYLLTGSSGVGKTTLARIIASSVNADIEEMCAATNSSVDDTRRVVEISGYKPLSGKPKLLIIDECHNLSEKAWEPLLKLSEEPPSYLYIAFCTTNERKVPKTIKTRAYPVSLKDIHPLEIDEFVVTISELEGWSLENDVRTAIVQASDGSPRKALSILQAGHGCKTRDELSQIITEVESESGPVDELCRELVKGNRNFKRITQLIAKIDNYDEAIDQICSYLAVSLLRSEEKQAQEIWRMLAAFTHSRTGYNGKVNIATAIGTILWGNMVF